MASSASAGHPCSDDSNCDSSQYCVGSRCVARKASGASCISPLECPIDEFCFNSALGSTCTKKNAVYQVACTKNSECKQGFCKNSVCQSIKADGSACAGDSECSSGFCSSNVCSVLPSVG